MKFSIGQVSKLFEISKDTLRHYDKIGILKPEVNENNGYRYYSIQHIEKLGLILGTKYLGVSLSDIKNTIESEDINEYKHLITRQEDLIKEKIKKLQDLEIILRESKKTLNKIIDFENKYDFSKLKIKDDNYNLYGIDIKKVLDGVFYKEYLSELETDLASIEEEAYFYIFEIIDNKQIIEHEDVVFIKEYDKNKDLIKKHLSNEKVDIIKKTLDFKMVSVDFYGTIDEINQYIIDLNKYFKCRKNNKAYVMYEFSLPKKEDKTEYFVNINLEITK